MRKCIACGIELDENNIHEEESVCRSCALAFMSVFEPDEEETEDDQRSP